MKPVMECTVMVVDDSLFMRNILRTILVACGCEVVAEANDGEEAVEKYFTLRPMITFMDILMPIKSGIDATKLILTLDKNAKVVMCSSLGFADLINSAREAGAVDVIFKPYEVEDIKEIIKLLMST